MVLLISDVINFFFNLLIVISFVLDHSKSLPYKIRTSTRFVYIGSVCVEDLFMCN